MNKNNIENLKDMQKKSYFDNQTTEIINNPRQSVEKKRNINTIKKRLHMMMI